MLTPAFIRNDGRSTEYYRTHPEARAKKVAYQAKRNKDPKQVAYRVELKRERRRRGIYGKGGPDMSHTESGQLVPEDPSKNRARNGHNGKTTRRSDAAMQLTPASVRTDRKCGKSGIAPGKKCTKPTSTARSANAKKRSSDAQRRLRFVAGAAAVVVGGALTAATLSTIKRHNRVNSIANNLIREYSAQNMRVRRMNRQAEAGTVTRGIGNATDFMRGHSTPTPPPPPRPPQSYLPTSPSERRIHTAWTTPTPSGAKTSGVGDPDVSAAWVKTKPLTASRVSRLPNYEKLVDRMWKNAQNNKPN